MNTTRELLAKLDEADALSRTAAALETKLERLARAGDATAAEVLKHLANSRMGG